MNDRWGIEENRGPPKHTSSFSVLFQFYGGRHPQYIHTHDIDVCVWIEYICVYACSEYEYEDSLAIETYSHTFLAGTKKICRQFAHHTKTHEKNKSSVHREYCEFRPMMYLCTWHTHISCIICRDACWLFEARQFHHVFLEYNFFFSSLLSSTFVYYNLALALCIIILYLAKYSSASLMRSQCFCSASPVGLCESAENLPKMYLQIVCAYGKKVRWWYSNRIVHKQHLTDEHTTLENKSEPTPENVSRLKTNKTKSKNMNEKKKKNYCADLRIGYDTHFTNTSLYESICNAQGILLYLAQCIRMCVWCVSNAHCNIVNTKR